MNILLYITIIFLLLTFLMGFQGIVLIYILRPSKNLILEAISNPNRRYGLKSYFQLAAMARCVAFSFLSVTLLLSIAVIPSIGSFILAFRIGALIISLMVAILEAWTLYKDYQYTGKLFRQDLKDYLTFKTFWYYLSGKDVL